MTRIEQRLRNSMGLDADSIGSSAIQRTVRLRMKARGLQKVDQYFDLIEHSPAEWNELVESVVVTETWFFRDRESYGALLKVVKEEWLPEHARGTLRILSVPCSSGEEPYSLAMALLDAGLAPERFRIDAADISERALARAKEGTYTRNSFRGKDLKFRDKHFYTFKDGFVLDSKVRAQATFFQGNLLSEDFPIRATYDVIFCRNLLIYFDRPTQKKALEQINRLLVAGGVLFVGPAEQPLITLHGFVPLGIPMAFASRKNLPGIVRLPRPTLKGVDRPGVGTFREASHAPAQPLRMISFEDVKPPKAVHTASHDLETARMLADAGNLKEAATMCEAYLRGCTACAHGWYLLGLIREASQDSTAVDCYRKALYLDPNHYETLLQMALLAEKDGNAAGARTFRNRADRLKPKNLRAS